MRWNSVFDFGFGGFSSFPILVPVVPVVSFRWFRSGCFGF